MTFHHHRFRAYKQPDAHHYVIISKGLHFSVLLKKNNFNTNLPTITNRLFITHYYKNITRERGLTKSENSRVKYTQWQQILKRESKIDLEKDAVLLLALTLHETLSKTIDRKDVE